MHFRPLQPCSQSNGQSGKNRKGLQNEESCSRRQETHCSNEIFREASVKTSMREVIA